MNTNTIQTTSWYESIGSIIQREREFNNYPPFQRLKVWTRSYDRRLIDSILRGFPIGTIVVVRKHVLLSGTQYLVLDGQQRLHAILLFAKDGFTTQNRKGWSDEYNLPPIEPNTPFSGLSNSSKLAFLQYKLNFTDVTDIPSWELLGPIFRRLQWANKLKTAEMLWSYQHPDVLTAAAALQQHPYFTQVYTGDDKRKQKYHMVCFLLILSQRIFANVSTPNLHRAAGSISATTQDIDDVKTTLDRIVYLFDGYQTHSVSEIVLFYQTIKLLERAGCNIVASKEGICGLWWANLKISAKQSTSIGYNAVQKVNTASDQARFWQQHFKSLVGIPGLVFRDSNRRFSDWHKMKAWLRQDRLCAKCGKILYLHEAIGHHVIGWADGGPTNDENCAVLHAVCHANLSKPQQEALPFQ